MPRTYVHFLITKNDIRRSVELRRFWMLGRNIAFEPGFMRNLIGGGNFLQWDLEVGRDSAFLA
jgi:hypothetical protein